MIYWEMVSFEVFLAKTSVFDTVLLMPALLKSFLRDFGLSFLKLHLCYTLTTAKLHIDTWLKCLH